MSEDPKQPAMDQSHGSTAEPEDTTTRPVRETINTSGGAYVSGNIKAQGDFVGRDKITNTINIAVHTLDRKVFRRLGLSLTAGFVSLGVLTIVAVFALFFALRSTVARSRPSAMAGAFNVAVTQFALTGDAKDDPAARRFSEFIFKALQRELGDRFEVWGPEWSGEVVGRDGEARNRAAAELADSIAADVVVYGLLDTTGTEWQFTPAFHVSTLAIKDFQQAAEITGDHAFGKAFSVGQGFVDDREDASSRLAKRMKALASIIKGLSQFAKRRYDNARSNYEDALDMLNGEPDEGQQVVYQMLGSVAGKEYQLDPSKPSAKLDIAQQAYERAIRLDKDYARAYLGLAGIYYLRAIHSVTGTQNFRLLDMPVLDLAMATYMTASHATHQSAYAAIPTRVAFGLGQCYLVLAQAGKAPSFDDAVEKFSTVIQAYAKPGNQHLKQIAAESHARLGYIYALFDELQEKAAQEYGLAAGLTDDPQRRDEYQQREKEIRNNHQK
jgi:tetratricopeptide (TPR) repeat protein